LQCVVVILQCLSGWCVFFVCFCFCCVIFGAFGAHLLDDILNHLDKKAIYNTAVNYHFFHTFLIIALGLLYNESNIKNIKTNLAWKNYERKVNDLHTRAKMAKKQAKLMSEQRARVGASGVTFTGSPIILANADWQSYKEDLLWEDHKMFIAGMTDENEATSLIASEYYKAGSTILNAGIGWKNYQTNKAIAESKGVG